VLDAVVRQVARRDVHRVPGRSLCSRGRLGGLGLLLLQRGGGAGVADRADDRGIVGCRRARLIERREERADLLLLGG
jgi:hypothetical protein